MPYQYHAMCRWSLDCCSEPMGSYIFIHTRMLLFSGNGFIVTDFLLKWTKPTHAGKGMALESLKGDVVRVRGDYDLSFAKVAPGQG